MPDFIDAQAALGFVTHQRTHIETEVLKRPYPAVKYAEMIPIDTTASPFSLSVTHFTQDATGRAKFISGKGDDVPLVNISGSKFEQMVNMAGVGYSFSLEEIGAAQQMGTNLQSDGAQAARESYEQFVDEVAFAGDTTLGIEGFYSMTGVPSAAAGATFAASTPDAILAIINTALNAIYTNTLGIEMGDTIALPLAEYARLSSTRLGDGSDVTILDYIRRANVYTAQTGQPLSIFADRRLTTKMVVYRRDPSVLKMHVPMPLRFIAPQSVNLEIKVLGMFRFAPVNIRKPQAVRYVTGIAS